MKDEEIDGSNESIYEVTADYIGFSVALVANDTVKGAGEGCSKGASSFAKKGYKFGKWIDRNIFRTRNLPIGAFIGSAIGGIIGGAAGLVAGTAVGLVTGITNEIIRDPWVPKTTEEKYFAPGGHKILSEPIIESSG
jgi:hypothetical protein